MDRGGHAEGMYVRTGIQGDVGCVRNWNSGRCGMDV